MGGIRMILLEDLLKQATMQTASDVHITVGLPPLIRVNGKLVQCKAEKLMPKDTEAYARQILTDEQYERYAKIGELDMSFAKPGISRFRVNVFKQRGSDAMVLRTIPIEVPTLDSLSMPPILKELVTRNKGLVVVTGPTGSGKSTTLAAMIDEINRNRSAHIITLEDPIEYLHRHKKSVVNQREIGNDTKSYGNALRAALREDPDVILVGEMRDLETISIAVTAAETGHLVFSTLHTIGASKTVDRIVDVFPPNQQQQIKVQLSGVLEGVISQQLIENVTCDGRVCAMEIMTSTTAIRNLIREGKTHQIDSAVQTGMKFGMKSMDMALIELYHHNKISYDEMIKYCIDKELMDRYLVV
jgi:twitching motility protein PilT